MSTGAFPCSNCGARLEGTPGDSITCPYCQARLLVPDMRVVNQLVDEMMAGIPLAQRTADLRSRAVAQVLAGAGAAVSQRGGASAGGAGAAGYVGHHGHAGPSRELSAEPGEATLLLDPQLGPVVVGKHEPLGQPPSLRAWDPKNKRVLWEMFKGQTWVTQLDASSFRLHGRTLYVANRRNLVALDLASGHQKWGAQLPDEISRYDELGEEPRLVVEDAFPPNQPGVVLVKTEDNVLSAFDRDSGRPLYQRTFGKDSSEFTLQAVPHGQVALVTYGRPYNKCERINPAYAQPLSVHGLGADGDWSCDLGVCGLYGRSVVTRVESFGPESDQDGALVFDAITGQRYFFEQVDDLEEDILPETMNGRVFFGVDDGQGMWVGPRGATLPSPAQGFKIKAWKACGPTLFVLLVKARGTEVRRVIGLDPNTLAMRFDCGMIGTEPDGLGARTFVTDGQTVAYVTSPQDDMNACEIVAVDAAAGFRLWSKPVGGYRAHELVLGQLLVRSDEKVALFSLRQGEEIGSFP